MAEGFPAGVASSSDDHGPVRGGIDPLLLIARIERNALGHLSPARAVCNGCARQRWGQIRDEMFLSLLDGSTDISPVDGINYTQASNRYLELMRKRGSLAFLCNHGGGHSVPRDSQMSAWRFLQDHPFGVQPSPYAMQLPSGFLRYCELPD